MNSTVADFLMHRWMAAAFVVLVVILLVKEFVVKPIRLRLLANLIGAALFSGCGVILVYLLYRPIGW